MPNRYEVGAHDTRPWGSWLVIDAGPNHTVKRLVVNPGAILSLQYHHGRDEHWVVVEGMAEVTLDDRVFTVGSNGSVNIKRLQHHRVANPGDKPLVMIEVQYGELLDEDDIVRLDDAYGRVMAEAV
ncbi:MAG: hypothetical protein Alpg2KO_21940 [Alphaproteobacteria bacterium]